MWCDLSLDRRLYFWGLRMKIEKIIENLGENHKNFNNTAIIAHKTCLACKISNVLMSTDHAKFPLIFSHVNRKHTSCLFVRVIRKWRLLWNWIFGSSFSQLEHSSTKNQMVDVICERLNMSSKLWLNYISIVHAHTLKHHESICKIYSRSVNQNAK